MLVSLEVPEMLVSLEVPEMLMSLEVPEVLVSLEVADTANIRSRQTPDIPAVERNANGETADNKNCLCHCKPQKCTMYLPVAPSVGFVRFDSGRSSDEIGQKDHRVDVTVDPG